MNGNIPHLQWRSVCFDNLFLPLIVIPFFARGKKKSNTVLRLRENEYFNTDECLYFQSSPANHFVVSMLFSCKIY
ncbi:hypothetical protein T4D_8740 [Trichinella pseudospiralis]|uniref:Uncharacterized protein n=1 Tax=Trichinella pseudospiralis TaxID=6337 RepID=A0A0V1FMD1_TRIPS|nr:hypothetical protein T4D_8740 [Trichinella pseudospiralis]